jgi:hypothetical protein
VSKVDERWDALGDNPLVMVDELSNLWAEEVTEFMDDEDFGKVLDIAIRIISGEIPEPAKVAMVCVKLEAYAIKFRTLYSAYMGFKKGTAEANQKKNLYKELYTGIDRLVDSLKYLVK